MSDETKGVFDDAFEVSEGDVQSALKPPAPWPKGTKARATVKAFSTSPEPGKSGFKYNIAVLECEAVVDGHTRTKTIRDNSLSLSPAAKGKYVKFCSAFGLGAVDEINAVRRGELSPVGLTGDVVIGVEDGQDGNVYNRIAFYNVAKK